MLDHRFGASKWNVKSSILIVAASTRLVLPENRSKPGGSGETTASGANREIASSAKSLNWESPNCHPFQRIAFPSIDIFAD